MYFQTAAINRNSTGNVKIVIFELCVSGEVSNAACCNIDTCASADCGNEFKQLLPVKFQAYPVKCPKCGQRSAYILTHCWKCNAAYPLDLKHPLDKCPKCNCDLPKY